MEFYSFGPGNTINSAFSAALLGGKGKGLVDMTTQGIPVPPGFIIPTTVWAAYDKKPKTTMKEIAKVLPLYLAELKAHFGYLPLLSVRSGAPVSCPGMMDTVLNVGLDETTSDEWIQRIGPGCYGDSLHRLVTMYGSVVKGINRELLAPNLSIALQVYEEETKEKFPTAKAQLLGAIEAVFKSWDNDRADYYRTQNKIDRNIGTAVTVQAMVFGNLNDKSGTGVLFTRNPNTGAKVITGEFLANAQGEDIVAGIRTPEAINPNFQYWNNEVAIQLGDVALKLEAWNKDVQDIEFTVQDGKLFILQTRNAKRTPVAALRIALDLVKEGVIAPKQALARLTARQIDLARVTTLDPTFTALASYTGTGAASGIVSGRPVFSKEDAVAAKDAVILVTEQTTPDDIAGMDAAVGVITMIGGYTSHAAVVARGMNKPCIVGVGANLEVFKSPNVNVISIDGETGRVWLEEVPVIKGESNGLLTEFEHLVHEALGTVPIFRGEPKSTWETAVLAMGARILDTPKAAITVAATLAKVQKLYVDVRLAEDAPEAAFFKLVEKAYPVTAFLKALETGLTVSEKARLVIIGPDIDLDTSLNVLQSGSNLESLILADGELLLGANANITGKAYSKVLQWQQEKGLQMVSLGALVAGTKSMVSTPQALGLSLKGE